MIVNPTVVNAGGGTPDYESFVVEGSASVYVKVGYYDPGGDFKKADFKGGDRAAATPCQKNSVYILDVAKLVQSTAIYQDTPVAKVEVRDGVLHLAVQSMFM